MNTKNKITYRFNPDWSKLERIQKLVSDFCFDNSLSRESEDSLQMVCCELVENAIKYGHFPDDQVQIEMSLRIKNKSVTIEVRNQIKEEESHSLVLLDGQIQWIRGYQNPYEAYVEKLKDITSRELKPGESGLGLVRIAYEGNSILDFYVDENNILSVSAVYQL